MKIYGINLDRRKDKWDILKKYNEKLTKKEIIRVSAIDGSTLESTLNILKLFNNCVKIIKNGGYTPGIRKGVVGCALSHIKVWEHILYGDEEHAIIIEDDAVLEKDFDNKLECVLNKLEPGWELVFLGLHPTSKTQNSFYAQDYETVNIKSMGPNFENENLQNGGTFGYMISRKCCEKILKHYNAKSINGGIDCSLIHLNTRHKLIKINYLSPCIIRSSLEDQELIVGKERIRNRGDIQKNYELIKGISNFKLKDIQEVSSPIFDGEKYSIKHVITP